MRTRQFHEQSGSRFAGNIARQLEDKRLVARAVVDQILWPNTVDSLLVGDGSSTSYVWCYYMEKWLANNPSDHLNLYTNNYDLPLQCLCEPTAPNWIKVLLAPGDFYYKFCATFGTDTEEWIASTAPRKTCLLAVTALDAEEGPCGMNEAARAIKTTILEKAEKLIVVADAEKLSLSRETANLRPIAQNGKNG